MSKRRAYMYLAHPGQLTATYRADQEQMVVRRALWRLLGDVSVQVACSAGDPWAVAILRAAVKPWRVRGIEVQEWAYPPLSVGQTDSQSRLEAAQSLAVRLGQAYPAQPFTVAIATCQLPLAELNDIRPKVRSAPLPGDILVVSLALDDGGAATVERADFLLRPRDVTRPRRSEQRQAVPHRVRQN